MRERFWSKVDRREPAECWEWLARRDKYGYGKFWVTTGRNQGRSDGAHRVAYELLIGPIPDGLVIDHLCRNRGCVNPAHMEIVTPGENARRAVHAKPTHCPHGHEYTPANTYLMPGVKGGIVCRKCRSRRSSEWKRRAAATSSQRELTHGRRYTYDVYGCRCDACKGANAEASQRQRDRVKVAR